MAVHATACEFLTIISESVGKQSLFKWIFVIPAREKKKAHTMYFLAPTTTEILTVTVQNFFPAKRIT